MNKRMLIINKRKILLVIFIIIMFICQFRMANKQGYLLLPLEIILICFFGLWNTKKNILLTKGFSLYLLFILYRIVSSLIMTDGEIGSIKAIFYRELFMLFMCNLFVQNLSKEWIIRKIRDVGFVLSILGFWEFITKNSIFMNFITVESRIYMQATLGTAAARVRTIFIHPIICSVFTTVFWLCLLFMPYKNKWMDYLAKMVMIISLLGTQSRSGWLSFAIVSLIYVIKKPKKNMIKIKRKGIYRIAVLSVMIVTICCVYNEFIYSNFLNLLNRALQALNSEHAGSYNRIIMIKMGLNEWIDMDISEKLFGAGGGYALKLLQSNSIRGWNTAVDNQYITILLDYGIIGLFFMLILIVYVMKRAFSKENKVYQVCGLSLLSMFISCFFYEMFPWIMVTFLFSLLLSTMESENKTFVLSTNRKIS